MNKIKELDEKRKVILDNLKEYVQRAEKEGREMNADENKQFDAWFKESEELRDQATRMRNLALLEAEETEKLGEKREKEKDNAPVLSAEERKLEKRNILSEYIRYGWHGMSPEVRGKAEVYKSKGFEGEKRAQSTTTTEGGYTIDTDVAPELIQVMAHYGPFIGPDADATASKLYRSSKGGTLYFPKIDDTSLKGVLLAEAGDSTSGHTDAAFDRVQLDAYKYTSRMFKVNSELLQDSEIDIAAEVFGLAGTRLGRAVNTDLTTANGSSKPQGVVAGATFGKVSAATQFTRSEMIDLKYSINVAYHSSPKFAWMMHPLIMASIVKLTIGSSDDRPLWQAGDIQRGIPDQLEGMKIFLNSDMASTLADGNKVLLAGDFDKFYVRETLPMVLKRTDERYIETDQVGFVAFARFDSVVADTTAIKYLDIT